MSSFIETFRVWKIVFGRKIYLGLAFLIGFLFYAFNVFILNISSIFSISPRLGFIGSLKFYLTLLIGFKEVIQLYSFISVIIISLMFGILFSLIVFKINSSIRDKNKETGWLGGIGIALGILAPGCAVCGIGLLSVLGLGTAFVTVLPFDGLEISILAIGILGFVIFRISEDIKSCKVCQISLNNKEYE